MNAKIESIIQPAEVKEEFVFESAVRDGHKQNRPFSAVDPEIKRLKEIVLSIDWEMSADNLRKAEGEIERLEKVWQGNKVLLGFLKIMKALNRYIHVNQAAAHQDAVKLFYSVYNALERVKLSAEMSEARKMEIVQAELHKYNLLRQRKKIDRSEKKQGVPKMTRTSCPEKSSISDIIEVKPALAGVSGRDNPGSGWSVGNAEQGRIIDEKLADFFWG